MFLYILCLFYVGFLIESFSCVLYQLIQLTALYSMIHCMSFNKRMVLTHNQNEVQLLSNLIQFFGDGS